ncbi:unnamed protein product, partial [Meganyctiphanes norvegica]
MQVAILVLVAVVGSVTSHSIDMGSCPRITPQPDFDLQRFTGTWYVIEVFGRQSKCFTLTFNQVTDQTLTVTEAKEFYLIDKLNMDYAHTNTGTLTIEDPSMSAKMRVRWPDNIAGSATFTIMDTDYDNYALFAECQKLFLISRSNAAILSRNNTLDPAIIEQLKSKLDTTGLDSTDFASQRHDNCIKPGESDSDLSFIFNEVKKGIIGSAGDSAIDEAKKNIFGLIPDDKLNTITNEEQLADELSFERGGPMNGF